MLKPPLGGFCFIETMTTTVYGISNCDTVRKARKWLDSQQIAHQFYDFRKDGLDAQTITNWLQQIEWTALFNKRSTTYRQLSDEQKSNLDQHTAITLMLEHPTLVKRPVLVTPTQLVVGFNEKTYQATFESK